jgi:hypothetical protein
MDPLFQILKRLTEHEVEYVLVGGMAAVLHGSSVVTQDVDVCAPLEPPTPPRVIKQHRDKNPGLFDDIR